ncbi:hypothetical protein M3629_03750 [Paenibacillus polysaccharolyticus]|uniref:hypothetical protein n=1 Tax=Paenibacillus polysaccharolyticus TaxID=582692 RepID=UPI00203A63E6|nr:hypothetical protein [Paenibacillus polysaccharolyticus]MCM3131882.1 hypothetical protein [Paenibacillus polysaccharolyticus]
MMRGADGSLIPYGKVYKELKADFLTGALPTWLETVGTVSYEPLPDRGTITVATAATAGNSAELKTSSLFDTTKVTAIQFTLEALQLNGNISVSVQVGIKSVDSKAGITFFHNVNQAKAFIRAYKADGTYTDYEQKMALFTVNTAGDEGQNRKNLTLTLLTGLHCPVGMERPAAYLSADDQFGGLADLRGVFTHGQVQCIAKITTSVAESKYIKCSQVKVGLWSN